jgi:hypothetical protein
MDLLLALATYRLTRMVLKERLPFQSGEKLRNQFLRFDEWGQPKGEISYWLTCPWCCSAWVGVALGIAYYGLTGQALIAGLAYSAVTGLLWSWENEQPN